MQTGCEKGILVKAWPLIPTWERSKINPVFRNSCEFSCGFHWDLITARLLPLLSSASFLPTGIDHEDAPVASCTLIPSEFVSWDTQPATALVCKNEKANPPCFYVSGVQLGACSIVWLRRCSSQPTSLYPVCAVLLTISSYISLINLHSHKKP